MADKDAGRSGSKDSGRSCGRGHRPGKAVFKQQYPHVLDNAGRRSFPPPFARSHGCYRIAGRLGNIILPYFSMRDRPRQMAEEMQSYGANLIVVTVPGKRRTASSKQ